MIEKCSRVLNTFLLGRHGAESCSGGEQYLYNRIAVNQKRCGTMKMYGIYGAINDKCNTGWDPAEEPK
jgi:hypothetical protein